MALISIFSRKFFLTLNESNFSTPLVAVCMGILHSTHYVKGFFDVSPLGTLYCPVADVRHCESL